MKKSVAHPAFIERTLLGLTAAYEHAGMTEQMADRPGFLQGVDPRVKLACALLLIVAALCSRRLWVTVAIFMIGLALARSSWIPLRLLAARVWLGVLLFTGCIALPAIFVTPGPARWHLPLLHWPVTAPGLHSAAQLLLRAETSATLVLLPVLTTPWTQVLKALRALRVPLTLVTILGMTHRYIFLLLQLAHEQFQARRSRLVGALGPRQRRQLATASAGVLLERSIQLSGDVYSAMVARGFRGEIRTLDGLRMRARDWGALAAGTGLAALAWWLGTRP